MTTQSRARRAGALLMLAGTVLASVSCGDVSRTGRAPAYLVIDFLEGASGARPGEFGNTVQSDVETKGAIFEDPGQAQMRVLLKDQGNPGAGAGFSNLNWLKINRYRVVYKRADGRNVPGVDVPHPFDGAITATITNQPQTVNFTLVRLQAKIDPPLRSLVAGGAIAIATIADITFYGEDLAGNGFSGTGSISINFANWGDPD